MNEVDLRNDQSVFHLISLGQFEPVRWNREPVEVDDIQTGVTTTGDIAEGVDLIPSTSVTNNGQKVIKLL